MDIKLSWDLVLVAAFAVLFAYHFLLGQNSTIKLILSMYIAILTADGVAKILREFVFEPSPGLQSLVGTRESEIFTILRITLFLVAVVIFSVKGGFQILLEKHPHWAVRSGIHGVFSILGAGLFLSTILIYLSGNSFVEGMIHANEISIYSESWIARALIDFYQFWFSVPAIAFLATSFFFEKSEE